MSLARLRSPPRIRTGNRVGSEPTKEENKGYEWSIDGISDFPSFRAVHSKVLSDSPKARKVWEASLQASKEWEEARKQWSGRGATHHFFNEKSEWMKKWDLLMFVLIAFTATFTVWETSFLTIQRDGLFIFNRFVDVLFLTDVIVQFQRPFYLKNTRDPTKATWIHSRKRIAVHYICGWFPIDFSSAIPFDAIVFLSVTEKQDSDGGGGSLGVLRVLKVLKLLKLMRVLRGTKILKRGVERLGLHHSTLRVFLFFILIFLYIHWVACFFHMVPGIEIGNECSADADPPRMWIESSGMCGKGKLDVYLASLEFASMTLVMGFGWVYPTTPSERAYSFLCMIAGGTLYAYCVGTVCQILSMRDPATSEYNYTRDLLMKYMEENAFPNALRKRVKDYFDYTQGVFREKIYEHLHQNFTPKLQYDVAWHCHRNWLTQITFFRGEIESEHDNFCRAIGVKLKSSAYPSGEVVYTQGQFAHCLQIITRGIVILGDPEYGGLRVVLSGSSADVLSRSSTSGDSDSASPAAKAAKVSKRLSTPIFSTATFRSPGVIGEECILHRAERYETATSLTYVDLLTLNRSDLLEVLELGNQSFVSVQTAIRVASIKIALTRAMKEIAISNRIVAGLKNAIQGDTELSEAYADVLSARSRPLMTTSEKHMYKMFLFSKAKWKQDKARIRRHLESEEERYCIKKHDPQQGRGCRGSIEKKHNTRKTMLHALPVSIGGLLDNSESPQMLTRNTRRNSLSRALGLGLAPQGGLNVAGDRASESSSQGEKGKVASTPDEKLVQKSIEVAVDRLNFWKPRQPAAPKSRRASHDQTESKFEAVLAKMMADNQNAVKAAVSQAVKKTMVIKDEISLLEATSRGNLRDLKVFAEAGGDLEASDYDDRTALHIACSQGQLHLAKWLLSMGVAHSPVDRFGRTPMVEAQLSKTPHSQALVQELMRAGAALPRDSPENATEVHTLLEACARGQLHEVQQFARRGGDLATVDYDDRNALHVACAQGRKGVVKWLLEQGAFVDLNGVDVSGRTPLDECVQRGYTEIEVLLRSHGAVKEEAGHGSGGGNSKSNAYTDLLDASAKGELKRVQVYFDRGGNLDESDYDGRSALHLSCAEGHIQVVQFLLQNSATCNVADRFGRTPLFEAQREGRQELIDLLLKHGAVKYLHGSNEQKQSAGDAGTESLSSPNNAEGAQVAEAGNSKVLELLEQIVRRLDRLENIDKKDATHSSTNKVKAAGNHKEREKFENAVAVTYVA